MIEFPKRCRTEQSISADRKVWTSKCGCYRVVFSVCRYGNGSMPDRYYAQIWEPISKTWGILSVHYKKGPAFEACRKAERQGEGVTG